ncbi:MAG: putative glycoside hydrolase [Terriglobia bacterium]
MAAKPEIAMAGAGAAGVSPVNPAAALKPVSPASIPASTGRPGTAQLRVKATAPVLPPLAAVCSVVLPGTKCVVHLVTRNESLGSIISHYLPDTVYMRHAELEAALRQANSLGNTLRPGTQIWIPGMPLEPILDRPTPTPKDFVARGIYLTAYTAGSASGLDLIQRWKEAGGNAVVFDIKDFDGELHVPFHHIYAPAGDITIRNLPKFIHYLHSLQMHAIARIALFRDAHLAQTYPELAVHSRKSGKSWLENGKLVWTDPSNPAVQDYDLDLARLAAGAGADEIQFDYVRFPAEGDQADAQFDYQKQHPEWPRTKIITDFVGRATDTLHPLGVLVSIDVFGVMAWARPIDLAHTGQNIHDLSRHCDILSPMIYPSHFFGFDGYTDPGDAPEHFISESMQRFEEASAGSGVVLRPWLQAFGWRTKTYSPGYIVTQVRVAHQGGSVGFLFWNARNDYSKPFQAMPEVKLVAAHILPSEPAGPRHTSPSTRAF